jgi:hypothetical protein
MNTEALFLFLILLLGLVLCSFLGGNCNKEGLTNNSVYYGPNGATATIITNSNGTESIQLTQTSGSPVVIFTQSPTSSTTFTNPFGFTATISNGNIIFSTPNNGPTQTFTPSSAASSTSTTPSTTSTSSSTPPPSTTSSTSSLFSMFDNYNHYTGSGSSIQLQTGMIFIDASGDTVTVITNSNGTQSLQLMQVGQTTPMILSSTPPSSSTSATANTFYAPGGKITATVITGSDGQTAIQFNLPNGQTILFVQQGSTSNTSSSSSSLTSTQYYGSTGSPINPTNYTLAYTQPNTSSTQYYGPYGGSAGSVTGPQGNTLYYANAPTSSSYNNSNSGYGNQYYSTMPSGIPASQIPPGQEDLYILKSEIVPPVCPACPAAASCPRQEKCPPCPACARCPEPSFECKKVPNYNAIDNDYLPQPVLNDFSQFGM